MKGNLNKNLKLLTAVMLGLSVGNSAFATSPPPTSANLPVPSNIGTGATVQYDGNAALTAGAVADQSAAASQANAASAMNVNVNNPYITIDYNSFNVASGKTVNFNFNDPSQVVLNQVTTSGVDYASKIYGSINSTGGGMIILSNPNGLFFNGAQINVGSFIGTTAGVYGSPTFDGDGNVSNITFGDPSGTQVDYGISISGGTLQAAKNLMMLASGIKIDGSANLVAGTNGSSTGSLGLVVAKSADLEVDSNGLYRHTDDMLIASTVATSNIKYFNGTSYDSAPTGEFMSIGSGTNIQAYKSVTQTGEVDNVFIAAEYGALSGVVNLDGVMATDSSVAQNGSITIYASDDINLKAQLCAGNTSGSTPTGGEIDVYSKNGTATVKNDISITNGEIVIEAEDIVLSAPDGGGATVIKTSNTDAGGTGETELLANSFTIGANVDLRKTGILEIEKKTGQLNLATDIDISAVSSPSEILANIEFGGQSGVTVGDLAALKTKLDGLGILTGEIEFDQLADLNVTSGQLTAFNAVLDKLQNVDIVGDFALDVAGDFTLDVPVDVKGVLDITSSGTLTIANDVYTNNNNLNLIANNLVFSTTGGLGTNVHTSNTIAGGNGEISLRTDALTVGSNVDLRKAKKISLSGRNNDLDLSNITLPSSGIGDLALDIDLSSVAISDYGLLESVLSGITGFTGTVNPGNLASLNISNAQITAFQNILNKLENVHSVGSMSLAIDNAAAGEFILDTSLTSSSTSGTAISINATGNLSVEAPINTSGGDISLIAGGSLKTDDDIYSAGGNIHMQGSSVMLQPRYNGAYTNIHTSNTKAGGDGEITLKADSFNIGSNVDLRKTSKLIIKKKTSDSPLELSDITLPYDFGGMDILANIDIGAETGVDVSGLYNLLNSVNIGDFLGNLTINDVEDLNLTSSTAQQFLTVMAKLKHVHTNADTLNIALDNSSGAFTIAGLDNSDYTHTGNLNLTAVNPLVLDADIEVLSGDFGVTVDSSAGIGAPIAFTSTANIEADNINITADTINLNPRATGVYTNIHTADSPGAGTGEITLTGDTFNIGADVDLRKTSKINLVKRSGGTLSLSDINLAGDYSNLTIPTAISLNAQNGGAIDVSDLSSLLSNFAGFSGQIDVLKEIVDLTFGEASAAGQFVAVLSKLQDVHTTGDLTIVQQQGDLTLSDASFWTHNGDFTLNVENGTANVPSDLASSVSGTFDVIDAGDDTTSGGGDDTTSGGGDDTTSGGGDDTTSGGNTNPPPATDVISDPDNLTDDQLTDALNDADTVDDIVDNATTDQLEDIAENGVSDEFLNEIIDNIGETGSDVTEDTVQQIANNTQAAQNIVENSSASTVTSVIANGGATETLVDAIVNSTNKEQIIETLANDTEALGDLMKNVGTGDSNVSASTIADFVQQAAATDGAKTVVTEAVKNTEAAKAVANDTEAVIAIVNNVGTGSTDISADVVSDLVAAAPTTTLLAVVADNATVAQTVATDTATVTAILNNVGTGDDNISAAVVTDLVKSAPVTTLLDAVADNATVAESVVSSLDTVKAIVQNVGTGGSKISVSTVVKLAKKAVSKQLVAAATDSTTGNTEVADTILNNDTVIDKISDLSGSDVSEVIDNAKVFSNVGLQVNRFKLMKKLAKAKKDVVKQAVKKNKVVGNDLVDTFVSIIEAAPQFAKQSTANNIKQSSQKSGSGNSGGGAGSGTGSTGGVAPTVPSLNVGMPSVAPPPAVDVSSVTGGAPAGAPGGVGNISPAAPMNEPAHINKKSSDDDHGKEHKNDDDHKNDYNQGGNHMNQNKVQLEKNPVNNKKRVKKVYKLGNFNWLN